MRIELLCFGTELLKDKINTNSITVAEQLASVGFSLYRTITVGDDLQEVEKSLGESLERADCVLTCGGLGPTFDDLTREAVSKVLKRPLILFPKILAQIQKRFKLYGRTMPAENRKQALILKNARPILNSAGTAPGQIIEYGKKCLILLPGPPKELTPMMEQSICPYLKKKFKGTVSKSLVLHIFGMPESEIDEMIEPVVQKNWDTKEIKVIFGILAHNFLIDVKVSVYGKRMGEIEKTLNKIKNALRAILGEKVFGENEETLESVVGKLLRKRKEILSVAESCTGGLLSSKITDIPGSSDYFKESVITYSNESKIKQLEVKKETLKKFGAVSEETAKEMALGMRKKSGSDWALSVTGIAGPTGGTKEKPVGTVCFGLASKNQISTTRRLFSGTRKEVKEKSVLMALDLLRRKLVS